MTEITVSRKSDIEIYDRIESRMAEMELDDAREINRRISKLNSLNADALNAEYLFRLREINHESLEFYKELIAYRSVELFRLLRKKTKLLGESDMSDEDFVQACIAYYRKHGEITLDQVLPIKDFDAIMQAGKKLKSHDVMAHKEPYFKKFMALTGKEFANAH